MGDRDNPHTASADGTADEAGDASFEAADAPDTLVCDGGQPLWGRRLTRRARLWRGAVGVSVVLLVAYLLVGGPAMAFAAITAFWASHAPVTRAAIQPAFAGASYNRALLPPSADDAPDLRLTPAPSAAAVAYACWIAPRTVHPDSGPLHLFDTTDSGDHWQRLTLPTPSAPDCALVVDGADPRSIALLLGDNLLTDVTCALPTVYVSGDAGQAWRRVTWPAAQLSACNFHLASEAGHLFAWADTPLLPASQQHFGAMGRLIVSGDAGQSWREADAGLPTSGNFALLGLRVQMPTGLVKLLAQVDATTPGGSILVQSQDSSASWQSYGRLPGVHPQVIVSGDPAATDHGGWGRLYELAQSAPNGAAGGSASYSLATAYFNENWRAIPLPPPVMDVAGDQGGANTSANTSATNDYSNQVSLLGVGPGEHLLALRGALPTDETRQSPPRRIWQWNTSTSRWLLSDILFPGNVIATLPAWSQGRLTFWLMVVNITSPSGIILAYAIFDTTNIRQE